MLMRSNLKNDIRKYWMFYALLIFPILYFILFRYLPMYGVILSFRRYVPGKSAFGVEWVGLKYFVRFMSDSQFWKVFNNTIVLSVLTLVIGFPLPILFALALNEVGHSGYKRLIQTLSYLPKFLSTIIVVMMINALLSPSTGVINKLLASIGLGPYFFTNEPQFFRPIYIISDLWQFMGWNAILYLAALSGIDEELYEAAALDGVNRFQEIIHVTIPGILPTIVITFILAVGGILNTGFEKVLLLYTPSTYA